MLNGIMAIDRTQVRSAHPPVCAGDSRKGLAGQPGYRKTAAPAIGETKGDGCFGAVVGR
jgi:hypothetical protein